MEVRRGPLSTRRVGSRPREGFVASRRCPQVVLVLPALIDHECVNRLPEEA